jgi:NAD(P)-dependent dehydrogenase (short-subunit alcohol dehydrogenase family)
MQNQAAMQKKWNRGHASGGPPAYQSLDPTIISENLPAYRSCPPPPAYTECQHDESASSINLHSFPEGSTVLVIGAYTRQGMHIIDRLLEHQHSVRGIVANPRESAQTAKHFEARHGRERYQPCIISDPTAKDAFDAAARDCSGVVFVTNRSSPVAGCGVETLAKVMSVLGSAMIEADMNRFVYCYPAASSNEISQSMTGNNISSAQGEVVPTQPPSYESSRNGSELSRPETVPFSVELAIRDWIGVNQPGFALEIGESWMK